ncbi:MAG: cobalamin-dependent protein, partial [Candidatus Omnitrophica bacterium]|nr:cobalamin-dependent protein [Candidatus Omnitrophota bacterium]
MKILLMMPPMTIDENYANLKTVAANMPSMGLAYIYTAFKEAGCEVKFQDYQCQKVIISDIVSYIKKENFDLVGMQTYITNINRCFKVASLIKEKSPQTKIILGGPHATIFRDKVIEHDAIDYVAISEAEHTVKELIECLNKNIEPKGVLGLYYKDKNGKIHKNPRRPFVKDIDEFPVPAYEIFNADDYFPAVHIRGKRVHNIITSRGCPFKCTFCSATEVYGNRYKYQSIERSINEMKLLKEKMGVDSLQIYDDNFTTNKKRTKELCKKMIEENLNLQWVCYTRADTIGDDEMLHLMKKAGCYMIVVGIENGNERILKL